ncbi:hypothetical protein, partial [Falsiroseomonas sp. E2-1-a20]|uniref:hypothetical protein n=1 Tax=Falsiroseomonas sp. E2-1-a20 TaxID=3239300 RepID=UPI003F40457A
MFEQAACVPLVVASWPRVNVMALLALRRLLNELLRHGAADDAVAAADSSDQNRGDVHATPSRPPPDEAGTPLPAI